MSGMSSTASSTAGTPRSASSSAGPRASLRLRRSTTTPSRLTKSRSGTSTPATRAFSAEPTSGTDRQGWRGVSKTSAWSVTRTSPSIVSAALPYATSFNLPRTFRKVGARPSFLTRITGHIPISLTSTTDGCPPVIGRTARSDSALTRPVERQEGGADRELVCVQLHLALTCDEDLPRRDGRQDRVLQVFEQGREDVQGDM